MTYTCVPAVNGVPQGQCAVGFSETPGALLSLGGHPDLTTVTAIVTLGFIIGFAPIRLIGLLLRAIIDVIRS